MSVICGFISYDGQASALDMGNKMIDVLACIPADKVECWHNDKLFMSCHHQFFTREAVHETIPYYDSETDTVIVANAIIDNRKELLHTFNIPSCDWETYPDSRLIFLAYRKWGEKCTDHLLGDFTYVIYEIKKDKLVCSRDHAGRVTFYYTRNESFFAFSTVMKPLVQIIKSHQLNEQWIADFLAIPTVISELDATLTVYEDIKQLLPARTLTLLDGKLQITRYWDPMNAPDIRYKSDAEYDEAFLEILTEATECKLRSNGDIGILLSGGLDSSTIGSLAARKLKVEGKRLKSYTSIPMEGYNQRLGESAIADESSYVQEIVKMHDNIDLCFCRSEGKNSLTDVKKYLDILEQPFKSIENLYWHIDIYERAQKDNCQVLLSGQFGNITISHGDYYTHFYTLLKSGRLKKLFHEIQAFHKTLNISRRRAITGLLMGMLPLGFHKLTEQKNRYLNNFSIIHPDFSERMHEQERLDKTRYGILGYKNQTLTEYRNYSLNHSGLSQVAFYENKLGAYYHSIMRDPTKDKRIFEFCFNIPDDQYVKDGRHRVILRRAMKGILPDMLRLNYTKRGVQSADWIQRLAPVWGDISTDIEMFLSSKGLEKYINIKACNDYLNINRTLDTKTNRYDLRQLLVAYIFSMFLLKYEGGGSNEKMGFS